MGINKVVYGGKTLIDLTGDTVTADKLLEGVTAHGKDGEVVTGACTFDVDSNDANAAVAEVLKGKTAYLVDVLNPTVSFKKASGTIKAYGYAYATTKQSWGSETTTVYAFNGTNYYKSATYGSPTATNITLGISDGKLTGLPSGLSGGSLLVTRGI